MTAVSASASPSYAWSWRRSAGRPRLSSQAPTPGIGWWPRSKRRKAWNAQLLNSLVIELYPDLVDGLEAGTGSPERDRVDPAMSLGALKSLIETRYDWALGVDYEDRRQRHLFWYRSAEKDEPRLGERFNEPGAEQELPLGIGLMAAALHRELATLPAAELARSVGEFLLEQPRWRGILRRIQSLAPLPYAEIQDNLLGETCLPVDLLRCKLAIFGAAKFDPKSDRWTRITLYQGAPVIEELADPQADDWAFPSFPRCESRVMQSTAISFPLATRTGGATSRGAGPRFAGDVNVRRRFE